MMVLVQYKSCLVYANLFLYIFLLGFEKYYYDTRHSMKLTLFASLVIMCDLISKDEAKISLGYKN